MVLNHSKKEDSFLPSWIAFSWVHSMIPAVSALIEAVIAVGNTRDKDNLPLTFDVALQLLHALIDSLPIGNSQWDQEFLPFNKTEEIISPQQLVLWCQSLLVQMKHDHFLPTHIVAVANWGLPIYMALTKLMGKKVPMISKALTSYEWTDSAEMKDVDKTSQLFSLKNDLPDETFAWQTFLIVDDLVESGKTLCHVYSDVHAWLFDGRNYEKKWLQAPIIKTAVLHLKRDDTHIPRKDYFIHVDYFYQSKDVDCWLAYPHELPLPPTLR